MGRWDLARAAFEEARATSLRLGTRPMTVLLGADLAWLDERPSAGGGSVRVPDNVAFTVEREGDVWAVRRPAPPRCGSATAAEPGRELHVLELDGSEAGADRHVLLVSAALT